MPGGGFEPDRGVARRDPHLPIAEGALNGNQSRGSLLLRGLRPLGRAAYNAALSPPDYTREDSLPRAPSPVGVQHTYTKEMGTD